MSSFFPGAAYGVDDLQTFMDVEAVVYGAKLTPVEAAGVAEDIESVAFRLEPPEATLARLSQRLTGLSALAEELQDFPTHLVRLLGMLLTTVSARMRASQRASQRPSGSYSTIEAGLLMPMPLKKHS